MDVYERTTATLVRYGMTGEPLSFVIANTPADAMGLLIYGSRARGDYIPASDYDLILLVPEPRKTVRGCGASLSYYTRDQLQSASGTLFGTHLLRDAVVLWQEDSALSDVLSSIRPAAPEALLERVRELSIVLDGSSVESPTEQLVTGRLRLARYLLRTAVYATAMAQGRPCFSVRELAVRFGDPALETLLASDPALQDAPSKEQYDEITTRLERMVGPLALNPFDSVEELIVEMWDVDRVLAAVAVRTLAADGAPFDYTDLPKVVL